MGLNVIVHRSEQLPTNKGLDKIRDFLNIHIDGENIHVLYELFKDFQEKC
ncbi:MAG: hypothetical protein K2N51_04325 [Lachnospiraceae bacterium]|nr:hypothetical protein [Lachnospiraceae bacterium]